MKTIHIIKNGVTTNSLPYNTQADVEHYEAHVAMGTFGTSSRTEVQSFEVSPAVIAEDGTEIAPAVIEEREVTIPGDFEFFIEDLTAQLEQEARNAAALKFLNETDYKILRHLRQQNLGIATTLTAEEFMQLERERQMAADSIV